MAKRKISANNLQSFIEAELEQPIPSVVRDFSSEIADRFGSSALAVVFYGSCLRTGKLEDQVLDFYVIVDDYRTAYKSFLLSVSNAFLPPNVFYREWTIDNLTLRAKYAVLSRADFMRRTKRHANISVWARFSQPLALSWLRDEKEKTWIVDGVSEAVLTMLWAALPTANANDPQTLWSHAFHLTYGAELRSEPKGKGLELYKLYQERYDVLTLLALKEIDTSSLQGPFHSKAVWVGRRINGKTASFLRLIKGAFTFDGGIDYLAWKISRHSGVEIEVTDAMRRHPVWSGLKLFIQLRRKGAFR